MHPHEMRQDAPADHTEKFQQKSSVHHPTVSMKFFHKKTCIPLHARPAALQMVLKVSLNRQQAYDEFGHRNTAPYMLCQIPGSWYGLPYGFPPQLHAPIEFHQQIQ